MDSRIKGEQFGNIPLRPQDSSSQNNNSQPSLKKSSDGFSASPENNNPSKAKKNTDAWSSSPDIEQNRLQKADVLNKAELQKPQIESKTKTVLEFLGELFISLFSQLPKENKDSISKIFLTQLLNALKQATNTNSSQTTQSKGTANNTASNSVSNLAEGSVKQANASPNKQKFTAESRQDSSKTNTQPISSIQISDINLSNQNQPVSQPIQAGSIQILNNQIPSSNQIGNGQINISMAPLTSQGANPQVSPQVNKPQAVTPQAPPPPVTQIPSPQVNRPQGSTPKPINPQLPNQPAINEPTQIPIPVPLVNRPQATTPQAPPPQVQTPSQAPAVTPTVAKPTTQISPNPFTANSNYKFPPLASEGNAIGQIVYESKPSLVPPKKTVIIIDDFNNPLSGIESPDELKQLSHGTLVVSAAGEELRKQNAQNNIKLQAINVSLKEFEYSDDPIKMGNAYFKQMQTALDKVGTIANQSPKDSVAVNISSGVSPSFDYLNDEMKNSMPAEALPITSEKLRDQKFLDQYRTIILNKLKSNNPEFAQYTDKLTALNKQGVKFFIASGNQENNSFDPVGLLPFVTSVGALDSSGNIADYTDLAFVQNDNLNMGDYQVKAVAGGYDFDSDGVKDIAAANPIDSPVFPGTSFASPREAVRDTAAGIKKQIQGLFVGVNA